MNQELAESIHLPPRALLGNFYTIVYFSDPMKSWRIRSAVRRFVRLRREFFEAAEAGIAAFGGIEGGYSAIHNRQGDWEKVQTKDKYFTAINSVVKRFLIVGVRRLGRSETTGTIH